MITADSSEKSFFKTSISRNHAYRVLHSRFPPFGFVLKPFWSIHMVFHIVMADSCQKYFFKTSISRNQAYRVLHSRFPPLWFVFKPVWSIHLLFNMIMADSCQKSFCGSIPPPSPWRAGPPMPPKAPEDHQRSAAQLRSREKDWATKWLLTRISHNHVKKQMFRPNGL